MHYTTASIGRALILRLEDGDPVYASIEQTAAAEKITHGLVWIIGGVKNGSVVTGPDDRLADAVAPFKTLIESFGDAREIAGIGMLFPGSDNTPRLHMHAAIGKGDAPIVGCPRLGLDCWLVNEVVILELREAQARRRKDPLTGFELLSIGTP